MTWHIKHDLGGKVIAELSTAELKRRLAILRNSGGDTLYREAYLAVLRERGEKA